MNYKKFAPKNCFVLYDNVKVDYKQLITHNEVERSSWRNTCKNV